MSGTIVNNVARASGTIAATPGGLDWSTAVVTASTVTVEAGRGYFINTTSNACTVTLPASPEVGDQIVLVDYARTWATNAVTLDSNGNNFQGEDDTYIVDYDTVGQSLNIVFSDSTKGWLPVSDDAVAFDHGDPLTQRALFAYGAISGQHNIRNLVSSSGVVAANATGAGTARSALGAAPFGGDKGIFAFGSGRTNVSNKVNNEGVVAADTTGVGTARDQMAGAGFGVGKAIFGFGNDGSVSGVTNLVSDSGVVAADVSAVGTARRWVSGTNFGGDKAIFVFGKPANDAPIDITNLVSNTGVVASNVTGVGTAREGTNSTRFGIDGKAVIINGKNSGNSLTNKTNIISNSGVLASDTTSSGTSNVYGDAVPYGGDKAIVAFGDTTNISRLITNQGVVGSDVTGVGLARYTPAATSYGYTA